MSARDRRALSYLAVALVLAAAYQFWPSGSASEVSAMPQSVETAEQRLARLRQIAATVPAKEEIHATVAAELEEREKGLIRAATGAQAQAQLVTRLNEVGSGDGLRIRPTELRSAISPLGDVYGTATVTVQFDCRVEQLVNFLAAVAAQPEIITTQDLEINASDQKGKTLNVRLTVAAVVPKELVPEKGASAF